MATEDPLQKVAEMLRDESRLFDITLNIGNEEIKAHRFVLVAFSTFFDKILQGDNQACEAITLTDLELDYNAIQKVIDFMYTSKIEMKLDEVAAIQHVAEVLNVQKVLNFLNAESENMEKDDLLNHVNVKENSGKKEFITSTGNEGMDGVIQRDKSPLGIRYEQISDTKDSDEDQIEQLPSADDNPLPESALLKNEIPKLDSSELFSDANIVIEREKVNKPEKKKYTIPPDTLNFLRHVKKKKKRNKKNVGYSIDTLNNPNAVKTKEENGIKNQAEVNICASNTENVYVIQQDDESISMEIDQPLETVEETEAEKFGEIEVNVKFGEIEVKVEENTSKKSTAANKVTKVPEYMLSGDPERKKGEPSIRSVLYKYTRHNETGWYICPREGCNFRSRHSKNVYTHDKTHTGDRKYQCPDCGKTFILKKNYRLHQEMHADIRPYPCDLCDKKFRSTSNLTRHQLSHSGKKPFICPEEGCEYACKDKPNLKKHVALKHRGEKPFVCDSVGCDYVAYDKASLEKHMVKHKDLQDRPHSVCTVCGKTLYGTRALQSHMLIHKGESFPCPHCSYSSVFKQALLGHTMRKHGLDLDGNLVERKYKCEKCEFTTFWEHDLKFHMTKHGTNRPFKCPICDYATVLKGSLQKHMRLHTGEQPFMCLICGKAYTNQSGLARHRRAHTGEKPHTCDICGKKYADLKTLRVHRYSHMNVKPFMCHLCTYMCTKKEVLITHFRRVHGEGNIPDKIRPRTANRVIMRVTSGQTADEIVHNIAPPGKGERYMIMDSDINDEKFMVIHEDDAELMLEGEEEGEDATTTEFVTNEGVFRVMQADGDGSGQEALEDVGEDGLDTEMAEDGKPQVKVMKIATAPRSPAKQHRLQVINQLTQLPQQHQPDDAAVVASIQQQLSAAAASMGTGTVSTTLGSRPLQFIQPANNRPTSTTTLPSITVTGQMAGLTGSMGQQNFIIVSGDEANLLKSLELQGQQAQLVAIPLNTAPAVPMMGTEPVMETSLENLQHLMMEADSQDLQLANVLAAVKSAAAAAGQHIGTQNNHQSQLSIAESLMQMTHPILQSQLSVPKQEVLLSNVVQQQPQLSQVQVVQSMDGGNMPYAVVQQHISDRMDGKADIIQMNDKQFEIIVDNVSHAPSEMFQHQSIDVSGQVTQVSLPSTTTTAIMSDSSTVNTAAEAAAASPSMPATHSVVTSQPMQLKVSDEHSGEYVFEYIGLEEGKDVKAE